jgi:fatty-acid desaturase
VQGYNVAVAGFISMGESWHNNHHAFPGSAKLGLFPGEVDPGWWLIKVFEALGLATKIKLPDDLPVRAEVRRLAVDALAAFR